jgi:hypothetical protein
LFQQLLLESIFSLLLCVKETFPTSSRMTLDLFSCSTRSGDAYNRFLYVRRTGPAPPSPPAVKSLEVLTVSAMHVGPGKATIQVHNRSTDKEHSMTVNVKRNAEGVFKLLACKSLGGNKQLRICTFVRGLPAITMAAMSNRCQNRDCLDAILPFLWELLANDDIVQKTISDCFPEAARRQAPTQTESFVELFAPKKFRIVLKSHMDSPSHKRSADIRASESPPESSSSASSRKRMRVANNL